MVTYLDKFKGMNIPPEVIQGPLASRLKRLGIEPNMIMSGDADVVTVYYRESPGRFLTVIGKLRPLPDGSGFLAVLIKRDKKTYAGGMACLKKELRDENGHLREGRERTFTKVSVSLIDRRKPLVPYLFTGVWDSISHHAS